MYCKFFMLQVNIGTSNIIRIRVLVDNVSALFEFLDICGVS